MKLYTLIHIIHVEGKCLRFGIYFLVLINFTVKRIQSLGIFFSYLHLILHLIINLEYDMLVQVVRTSYLMRDIFVHSE